MSSKLDLRKHTVLPPTFSSMRNFVSLCHTSQPEAPNSLADRRPSPLKARTIWESRVPGTWGGSAHKLPTGSLYQPRAHCTRLMKKQIFWLSLSIESALDEYMFSGKVNMEHGRLCWTAVKTLQPTHARSLDQRHEAPRRHRQRA